MNDVTIDFHAEGKPLSDVPQITLDHLVEKLVSEMHLVDCHSSIVEDRDNSNLSLIISGKTEHKLYRAVKIALLTKVRADGQMTLTICAGMFIAHGHWNW